MSEVSANTPEFRVVVRRTGRGPLAPYRFAVAISFALLIAGRDLLAAAEHGVGVDDALLRAGVAGLFAWVVLGVVNSILRQATPVRSPAVADSAGDADAPAERTAA